MAEDLNQRNKAGVRILFFMPPLSLNCIRPLVLYWSIIAQRSGDTKAFLLQCYYHQEENVILIDRLG